MPSPQRIFTTLFLQQTYFRGHNSVILSWGVRFCWQGDCVETYSSLLTGQRKARQFFLTLSRHPDGKAFLARGPMSVTSCVCAIEAQSWRLSCFFASKTSKTGVAKEPLFTLKNQNPDALWVNAVLPLRAPSQRGKTRGCVWSLEAQLCLLRTDSSFTPSRRLWSSGDWGPEWVVLRSDWSPNWLEHSSDWGPEWLSCCSSWYTCGSRPL